MGFYYFLTKYKQQTFRIQNLWIHELGSKANVRKTEMHVDGLLVWAIRIATHHISQPAFRLRIRINSTISMNYFDRFEKNQTAGVANCTKRLYLLNVLEPTPERSRSGVFQRSGRIPGPRGGRTPPGRAHRLDGRPQGALSALKPSGGRISDKLVHTVRTRRVQFPCHSLLSGDL